MALLFRVICIGAATVFAIQHNWLAILWVIVALIQHERAELGKRY